MFVGIFGMSTNVQELDMSWSKICTLGRLKTLKAIYFLLLQHKITILGVLAKEDRPIGSCKDKIQINMQQQIRNRGIDGKIYLL
jgi:hypothetical protein